MSSNPFLDDDDDNEVESDASEKSSQNVSRRDRSPSVSPVKITDDSSSQSTERPKVNIPARFRQRVQSSPDSSTDTKKPNVKPRVRPNDKSVDSGDSENKSEDNNEKTTVQGSQSNSPRVRQRVPKGAVKPVRRLDSDSETIRKEESKDTGGSVSGTSNNESSSVYRDNILPGDDSSGPVSGVRSDSNSVHNRSSSISRRRPGRVDRRDNDDSRSISHDGTSQSDSNADNVESRRKLVGPVRRKVTPKYSKVNESKPFGQFGNDKPTVESQDKTTFGSDSVDKNESTVNNKTDTIDEKEVEEQIVDNSVIEETVSEDYSVSSDDSELVVDEFEEQFAAFLEDDEESSFNDTTIEDDVDSNNISALHDSQVSVSPAKKSGMGSRGGKIYDDRSAKTNYDKAAIIEKYAVAKPRHKDKTRYTHYTDQGTVTGRQIQFYRNLNLTLTYDKHKVAELLKPPVDMQETPEQKALRERVIRQAIGGEEALRRGSKLRISDKDVDFLRFLARFRFANARHISQMYAEQEDTTARRLRRLRERGLVLSNSLYGTKPIFFVSEEGMILAGYSYRTLKENDINLASFSHMFGINHIASNLLGANVDVLDFGEEDWPVKNRREFDERTRKYKIMFGEMIVSEYEIQSSLGKRRTNTKSEIYKPKAQADLKMALSDWRMRLEEIKQQSDRNKAKHELAEHIYSSPEMVHENEWMWALYPENPASLAHHVPDLVIKRPRNPDGSPNSIAVELELNLKNSNDSYVKTLTAYKNDKNMYKEVVWISTQKTIRTRIEKIAKDVGLWDTGKIRVIPLYYDNGEWGNIDMWKI